MTEQERIMKGIQASYEALVDDSVPTREGEGKGRQGGWNKHMCPRKSRGMSRRQWADYQRRVEGVY